MNQLAVATGIALALKERKARNIAVLLARELGPGAKGYDELLRFAAGRKLPVIYLLQTATGSEHLRIQAQKCGLPGITVDGSDAVAMLRVVQECTRRAREGHGPSLIAYRLSADPLALMEAYLRKRSLWPGSVIGPQSRSRRRKPGAAKSIIRAMTGGGATSTAHDPAPQDGKGSQIPYSPRLPFVGPELSVTCSSLARQGLTFARSFTYN